jgi:hypothetical protein
LSKHETPTTKNSRSIDIQKSFLLRGGKFVKKVLLVAAKNFIDKRVIKNQNILHKDAKFY